MSWNADETSELPEPMVVDRDETIRVLEGHREWLDTAGRSGRRADLRRAILDNADLSGADLRRATFREAALGGARLVRAKLNGCDLRGACLKGADLTGASLRGANLTGADLENARLRDTDLQDADLLSVRALSGGQIGGANVAGAKLPEAIVKFEGLANVQESSRGAQTLFTSILLLCAYTWLTVFGTRDSQILNNASPPSARLPLLGTDIPLIQFYLVAPVLLLFLHVYFLLSLQKLWEELADLPAVFPDGRSLDKKVSTWMLNGLVCLHFDRLSGGHRALARWQARMAAAVAWGAVPVTLTLLWARYLRLHDVRVTATHVALVALAVGLGVGFYRLATTTLRAGGPAAARRPRRWARVLTDTRAKSALATLGAAALLGVLSHGAIEGVNTPLVARGITLGPFPCRPADPRVWIPKMLAIVGVRSFAAIDEVDLSTKPANWSGEEVGLVKGADLGACDLRFADAYGAFFVNAYLKGSDLRGADLREADLRGANLKHANLSGANLRGAKLQKADLGRAVLDRAVLTDADLRGADLTQASLRAAKLRKADLTGADLTQADLQGADLQEAKLQGAALGEVKLRGADLTGAAVGGDAVADPLRNFGKREARDAPAPAVFAPKAGGVPGVPAVPDEGPG